VASANEDDWVGRVFGGRFRVVRSIKRGGMGAVSVASDTISGDREVALKVVRRTLADDPEAIARFKREIRLMATLHHENVVTAIDAGEDDGVLWIAMEMLHGISLRECLEQRGHWRWQQTLPVVRQLALALSAAHGLGIIHRDLKPENVMLLGDPTDEATHRNPRIKLLDFGIAKQRRNDDDGRTHQTGTGLLLGTPGYVAPEAVLEGITDDPRSDFYGLGVTWFELLVGAAPFSAKTPMALAMRHAHEVPPSPSSLLPFSPVPAPVEALLARLLAKRPDERPADARAIVDAIDALATAALQPTPLPALRADQATEHDLARPPTGVLVFPSTGIGTNPQPTSATPLRMSAAATPASGPPSSTTHSAPASASTTTTPDGAAEQHAMPRGRWLIAALVAIVIGSGGVAVGARLASPTTTATTTTTTTATTTTASPAPGEPTTTTPAPAAPPSVPLDEAHRASPSAVPAPAPAPAALPGFERRQGAILADSRDGRSTDDDVGLDRVSAEAGQAKPSLATRSAPATSAPGTVQLTIVALPRAAGWKVAVDGGPARPTPWKVELEADAEHRLAFTSSTTTLPIVRVVRYAAGAATFQETLTP
jgi:serine/threonine protein kinase